MVMVVPCAKNSISPGATPRATNLRDAVEHAERRVLRRARHLLDQELAGRRVEQHQVGVGAADVDAEPVPRRAAVHACDRLPCGDAVTRIVRLVESWY